MGFHLSYNLTFWLPLTLASNVTFWNLGANLRTQFFLVNEESRRFNGNNQFLKNTPCPLKADVGEHDRCAAWATVVVDWKLPAYLCLALCWCWVGVDLMVVSGISSSPRKRESGGWDAMWQGEALEWRRSLWLGGNCGQTSSSGGCLLLTSQSGPAKNQE